MPFYSGKDGQLDIDGNRAAKVRAWQVTTNLTTLETTHLGNTDRTTIAGIRNTSGTCQLFYYAADPNNTSTNSASVLIRKLIKADADQQAAEPEEVTLTLRINDGTPNGKYIKGKCLLTSAAMNMAVGEVLSAAVSFEFIGSPTEMQI